MYLFAMFFFWLLFVCLNIDVKNILFNIYRLAYIKHLVKSFGFFSCFFFQLFHILVSSSYLMITIRWRFCSLLIGFTKRVIIASLILWHLFYKDWWLRVKILCREGRTRKPEEDKLETERSVSAKCKMYSPTFLQYI